MFLVRTNRKYFKYNYRYWKTWAQPTVTSNTDYGTLSSTNIPLAIHQPYMGFNKVFNDDYGDKYLGNGSTVDSAWGGDITWELPISLRASRFEFVNTDTPSRFPTFIEIQAKLGDSDWVQIGYKTFSTKPSKGASDFVETNSKVEFDTIRIGLGKSGSNYTGFCECYISAVYETSADDYTETTVYETEVSKGDSYDFFKDSNEYYAFVTSGCVYYDVKI